MGSKKKEKTRKQVEEIILTEATETTWGIKKPSDDFIKHFVKRPDHINFLFKYKSDMTANPLHSPVPKRISPLRQFPNEPYRWRYNDLRCVYLVGESEKAVFPIYAAPAGSSTKYKPLKQKK